MQTRITELLNVKYPIFQGGMAWVADGDLAGAVSNAGGLGIIGGGNAPKEVVKANIDKVKSITDKPFGVNIMLLSPFADDIVDLVIEEGVKVVTTGAGNPGKYMDRFHEAGITVIPVVPSVALAKRMEKLGADAVIAEGMEAGGHIGKLTTMTLVRQVVEAVSIPVIGAGGVADGAGAAAVFMLGAEAVQVGTRFVVAKESNAHQNFKNKILKAKDIDTVVSASVVGHPVRAIKNKLASAYNQAEKDFLAGKKTQEEIEELGAGALRNAVAAGKYSPADILPSCALWFLAAFVIGCAAYCCRATDKRIMITVGSTLAMLFFASAGGKTSSFVTEGTLWEKEGSCIRLDNGRFILSQGTDICDNWHLFLGQRVYVYRYDDIYFASGEKFSPATLAYTETIPNFTGLYLVCWLCAMALGYWTYATAEEKLKHRRLFAR